MSIRIDRNICVGCGACADVCPGNLPALDEERRAFIKRPEECWGCTACLKACPTGAAALLLAPELGGGTCRLHVRQTESGYDWIFSGTDGKETTLRTRSDEANKY